MPLYEAPVGDAMFILAEVLGYEALGNLPGFADAPLDVAEAVLAEGAKLSEETLLPLNLSGDVQGCTRHPDGRVTTPEGFKAAYKAVVDGGWIGLSADPAYGGQGLPSVLNLALQEFMSSANLAFAMYPGLSVGAIAALQVHGSPEQKALYLPPMIEGRWTGTMNLTEPQCGTDLGLIRTKARPLGDGAYAITGTKIFISAGEHDLAENIVHLVLARIEGAPEGTRGISLFIVPKLSVAEDGSLGGPNGVACGSIEHKMGIHANATCLMNYDRARGVLVGEANRGLAAMFVMMNEARLAVGVQGLAVSEVAYQNAAAYAKDRLQGRALTGPKAPERPADPIIVHPDIRRTLLSIRSITEAGRALSLWTALQGDLSHRAPDAGARRAAADMMGLMTPVVKGVLTDLGFDNAVKAQQVLGGHGYVEEWGMSQFVRDARIAMIYEGANGIQALDLVGRKLPKDGGRAVMAFFAEVEGFVRAHEGDEGMTPFTAPLAKALGDLQQATRWFMMNAMGNPDNAGAGSTDYMHLFGLVALGWMWARMAAAARARLSAGANGASTRMDAKLAVGRYFMERELPATATRLARIEAGAGSVMALPAESF